MDKIILFEIKILKVTGKKNLTEYSDRVKDNIFLLPTLGFNNS